MRQGRVWWLSWPRGGTFAETLAVAASSRRKSGNSAHLSPYRIALGLGSPEEHVQGGGKNKPPCRWPKQSDMEGSFPLVWPAENQGQLSDWKGPGDVFASSKSVRNRGKRMIQGAAGPPRSPDTNISSENVTAHRRNNLSAMRGVLKSLYYTSNVTIQRKSTLLLSTFVCVWGGGVKTFKGTIILFCHCK